MVIGVVGIRNVGQNTEYPSTCESISHPASPFPAHFTCAPGGDLRYHSVYCGSDIPLHEAVECGCGVTSMLLEWGADVNEVDGDGRSALHRAAELGFLRMVQTLLAAGADGDIRDIEEHFGTRPGGEYKCAGQRRVYGTAQRLQRHVGRLGGCSRALVAMGRGRDCSRRPELDPFGTARHEKPLRSRALFERRGGTDAPAAGKSPC